jgi:hypothetical protein
MKARSALVIVSLVVAGLAAAAPRASAVFHFMKVREVDAGTVTNVEADFVELQMYQAGQNQIGSHPLHLYDASGARMDCEIPNNVTQAADNNRILFATEAAEAALSFTADFTFPPLLHADGGAVCFDDIDCVSWGTFAGSTTSPAGTPEPAGIPPESSIDRTGPDATIDPNQDTNNSANDFETQTPDPNTDAALPQSTAMTCQPGGGGGGGGQGGDPNVTVQNLKAKTPGNKAIISGQIQPSDPGGKVKLTLYANGSPLRKVAKKSDTLDGDSKFKKKFSVPSDSTRCKVTVKYNGQEEAKKKFKC